MKRLEDLINSQSQSEQSSALRETERRLTDERAARQASEQQKEQMHQQEIRKHQQKYEALEREKNSVQTFGDSTSIIEDLKSGMEELLEEVKELAARNEELVSAQEADGDTIRELEAQVADYKKKYERAKTELRGLKG